ncbi:VWA domain-containing protein [Gilvimarinus agarilyticus]|uniref:vWA domain-containing protein n=1 Tax=Gilvimarinus sp. 2_MG-2023 TaxID=3062666 RepID=UPI001C09A468|nr:VWA domain-containing protein [Gilvimarinus sp. 2_MG-2023]MBU2886997.1 VWA domain-containing protein [Gilvimarinus agarilyticus]MDO6571657.1 VWA domain-containing protein [Gilvimarinus sp. 2_MG-2023]
MFEFSYPWLLLLLPLPIVMRWVKPAPANTTAIKVPFYRQLESLSLSGERKASRKGILTLLWASWLLLVLAASDPLWVGKPTGSPYSGRDMMLAVDLSQSMLTPDMQPPGVVAMQFQNNNDYTRMDAVKDVVGEFIERRSGDRLGLILFADQAYLQAPLSRDVVTVNQLLQEAQVGFAGRATAIGDALGLAIKRLKERPEGSRRIILLSDGANTAGDSNPIDAANIAANMGVKIYTIAFGSTENIRGTRRSRRTNEVDTQTLQTIANTTGGAFFRAESTAELKQVHQQLDQLEPLELEQLKVRPVLRLFFWPLGLALALTWLIALSQLRWTGSARVQAKGDST